MGKRRKLIRFDDKRLFYSIQEVADHFAVNVSLLRFWEKEFDNINPKKNHRRNTPIHQRRCETGGDSISSRKREGGVDAGRCPPDSKVEKKDDEAKRVEAVGKLMEIKKRTAIA